jgi:hypothetical protein
VIWKDYCAHAPRRVQDSNRGFKFRFPFAFICAAVFLFGPMLGVSNAQQFECPPPSVNVTSGYAIECRCPDGSLAGLYTGCPSSQPEHHEPLCPSGTNYCADSNQCCNAGFYCSHYGCTPVGAVECGTHFCQPGQQCTSSGRCMPAGAVDCGPHSSIYCNSGSKCSSDGKRCLALNEVDCGHYSCPAGHRCAGRFQGCLAPGDVDCGSYSCRAGNKCSSAGCISQNAVDCGNKTSCGAGLKCSRDHKHCFPREAVDCGTFSCNAGMRCGSGNQCLAASAVDCGGGRSCQAGNKCSSGGGCIPSGAIDCGHGVSCPAGQRCASGKQCLAKGDVDCGNGTSCGSGEKCTKSGNCIPANATACGSSYCNPGSICTDGKECLTKAQLADRAKDDARKKKEDADKQAAQVKAQKATEVLAQTLARSNVSGVASLKAELLATLPREAATEAVSAVAETTLKGTLSIAMPSTLSSIQRQQAAKELANLWTTNLTEKNLAPIGGNFAKGLVVGMAIDYAGNKTGDFLAAAVAKHTTNTFAINFARSSTQVAFTDAYASRGGVPGVLAANGVMITQASIGAAVDTKKAAMSFHAYEVQINDAIARARSQPDPATRDRMLRTAEQALSDLNALRDSHPVITTLSNMSVEGTVDTLRSWMP